MTIRCWDERFEAPSSSSSPTSSGSFASEAWSATYTSPTALRLDTGSASTSGCLRLPTACSRPNDARKSFDAVFKGGDHFELRLGTQEGQSSTRARTDLDIAFPYPAAAFRTHLPPSLHCSECDADLADLRQVKRYNDLPSEHWAELLDAWMCHEDQTLSEELVRKGNNIWPKDDQGLVSTGAVLLSAKNVRGWRLAHHSEVSRLCTARAFFSFYPPPKRFAARSCRPGHHNGLIRRPAFASGGGSARLKRAVAVGALASASLTSLASQAHLQARLAKLHESCADTRAPRSATHPSFP